MSVYAGDFIGFEFEYSGWDGERVGVSGDDAMDAEETLSAVVDIRLACIVLT